MKSSVITIGHKENVIWPLVDEKVAPMSKAYYQNAELLRTQTVASILICKHLNLVQRKWGLLHVCKMASQRNYTVGLNLIFAKETFFK